MADRPIAILHDDRIGHYLQAQQLSDALGLPYKMFHYRAPIVGDFAMVISVGYKPMRAAWQFKRKTRCLWVQIMGKGVLSLMADLHISPLHDRSKYWRVPKNRLHITGALLGAKVNSHVQSSPSTLAVFLGGPSHDYDYGVRDCDALLGALAEVGASNRLLISTSPRTAQVAGLVERLQEFTVGRDDHRLYCYGAHDTQNPKEEFLQNADAILVSLDSINMLIEACSIGVPVYYWSPTPKTTRTTKTNGATKSQKLVNDLQSKSLIAQFDGNLYEGWHNGRLDVLGRVVPVVEQLMAGVDVKTAIASAPDEAIE